MAQETLFEWKDVERNLGSVYPPYTCGFCNHVVAAKVGHFASRVNHRGHRDVAAMLICPHCSCPTFTTFTSDGEIVQVPRPLPGRDIAGISDVRTRAAFEEARKCMAAGAFTAAALLCRKILMTLAVSHGAAEDQGFLIYVDYLEEHHFVPPQGRPWVDRIRKTGNAATHKIPVVSEADAEQVLTFTEGLLRFNYELPHMMASATPQQPARP